MVFKYITPATKIDNCIGNMPDSSLNISSTKSQPNWFLFTMIEGISWCIPIIIKKNYIRKLKHIYSIQVRAAQSVDQHIFHLRVRGAFSIFCPFAFKARSTIPIFVECITFH